MCLVVSRLVSRVVSAKKGPSVAQETVERYINLAIWSASPVAVVKLVSIWQLQACLLCGPLVLVPIGRWGLP